MNLEQEPPEDKQTQPDPSQQPPPDDQDDAASLAVDDGKGNKMVPLSALIGVKRENRELAKKVKELEPVAQRATDIDQRLSQAQPIIDAILTNPKLRAEALRAQQGTRPSGERTEQPDDDPDAQQYAEEMGFYTADGSTPDVARARRILNIIDKRGAKHTEESMRPLAGLVAGSRADMNLREAMAQTDAHGVPLATMESIREVAAQLPAHLLADEKVIELVVNNAIGVDRRKGRTPKAPEEPLYLDSPGGRGRRETVITDDDRRIMNKAGLTEADVKDTMDKLSKAGSRGIALE